MQLHDAAAAHLGIQAASGHVGCAEYFKAGATSADDHVELAGLLVRMGKGT